MHPINLEVVKEMADHILSSAENKWGKSADFPHLSLYVATGDFLINCPEGTLFQRSDALQSSVKAEGAQLPSIANLIARAQKDLQSATNQPLSSVPQADRLLNTLAYQTDIGETQEYMRELEKLSQVITIDQSSHAVSTLPPLLQQKYAQLRQQQIDDCLQYLTGSSLSLNEIKQQHSIQNTEFDQTHKQNIQEYYAQVKALKEKMFQKEMDWHRKLAEKQKQLLQEMYHPEPNPPLVNKLFKKKL